MSEPEAPAARTALVVADGDADLGPFGREILRDYVALGRPLVVAADGGSVKAEALGFAPDVVVGDLDSLSNEVVRRLRSAGVEVQPHPEQKEESDLELAMREAVRRGADRLLVVGALGGGRPEHSLANILLLSLPQLAGCDAALVDAHAIVRVLSTPRASALWLSGRPGDLVSLLPLSERVDVVATAGLAYPLRDEPLWQGATRGLSNVMEGPSAQVTIRGGRLAVIHTRPDEAPEEAPPDV